jgi:hypothetical protein
MARGMTTIAGLAQQGVEAQSPQPLARAGS